MNIDEILHSPFTFSRRKSFTPCDTRPLWKSVLIIIIIGVTGKENSSSLKKIHTANWITKNNDHLLSFTNWKGKDDRKRPDVRLDPTIDTIINLIISNNFAKKINNKIVLTDKGVALFNELMDQEIFTKEKASLQKAKKYLSEAAVKRLFEGV